MKKLSKLGLTLMALALPLVTSSANAVGVDRPHGESKGMGPCAIAITQTTDVMVVDNLTCTITTTTATFPSCNQYHDIIWDCN
jgi:hypothetical protein